MKPPRPNAFRTDWAGALDAARTGDEVRLAGWVNRRRDHGGLIFIDLRDRTGIVQLVFDPDESEEAHTLGHRLRPEDVVTVRGTVVERDPVDEAPPAGRGLSALRRPLAGRPGAHAPPR